MMRSPLLLASLVALAPAAASADEAHQLFGKPVAAPAPLTEAEAEERQQAFQAMLDERGWQVEGDVVGPAELFADAPVPAQAAWDYPPHRHTIFLNFFGGSMSSGTNAAKMQSACLKGPVEYPGFNGSTAKALAIIQVFQSKMSPYGVRIAYEDPPPPELPYSMVMMGGFPADVGMPNGTLGVSCSSDCGDRWWRDTTFAFTAVAYDTNILATTALQEASHAFGLAHIDGSKHIMYPYATAGDKIWANGCTIYNDATGGINCKPTHDIFCGGGKQDDHAELMAYFGADSPDTEPPVVKILSPVNGVSLPIGSDLTVEADVQDNYDGVGWKAMFYQNDVLVDERPAFVFEKKWTLNKLPAGTYKVRVQALDHDGNIGADEVTIVVGDSPMGGTTGSGETEGTTGGDTDSAGTGGTGDASDSGASSITGATASDTDPGMDEDEGCNCRSAGAAPTGGLLLGLLGLGLLGRRRRP